MYMKIFAIMTEDTANVHEESYNNDKNTANKNTANVHEESYNND